MLKTYFTNHSDLKQALNCAGRRPIYRVVSCEALCEPPINRALTFTLYRITLPSFLSLHGLDITLPTYLLIYLPTYLLIYLLTYLLTYLPIYLLTYLPTCLLTYLSTYVIPCLLNRHVAFLKAQNNGSRPVPPKRNPYFTFR